MRIHHRSKRSQRHQIRRMESSAWLQQIKIRRHSALRFEHPQENRAAQMTAIVPRLGMALDSARAPKVEIRSATKIYTTGAKRFVAVGGVSMTVHDGEFVALVGPSGCGKST